MTRMRHIGAFLLAGGILSAQPAQPPDEKTARMAAGSVPIYRVVVIAKTAKAINYRQRSGATTIGFRGTELLSGARGEAEIESKQGYNPALDVLACTSHGSGSGGYCLSAVMSGLQQNTASEGGVGALLGALTNGNHSQYVENPELLGQQSTVAEGDGILGYIFGSKEVSRSVAGHAAQQTGIGTDIMKQMLPIVATMVMGSLSKQNAARQVPNPVGVS